MEVEFAGEVWYWRGPAPYHFVTVDEEHCEQLRTVARAVTYGWGMIPVYAQLGDARWETSLYPKNGGYVVPLKDAVRHAEGVAVGDVITIRLTVKGLDDLK